MTLYTWCTREEWHDELFSTVKCEKEHGHFDSPKDAREDAKDDGVEKPIIIKVD